MHELQANSILLSSAITLCIAWALARRHIPSPLAYPNERSLHCKPVPRIGGIAIWAGWIATWPIFPVSWHWAAPFAIVMLVSLVDDCRNLPVALRLAAHGVAAFIAAASMLGPERPLMVLFAALGIAWMANLFNFMDGADGLAGTMAIFGFAAYGGGALLGGRPDFALLQATLASACAAFLVLNLPPARLFMGDVGAVALGFIAAVFGIDGIIAGTWPWWFPPLVFAPFIMDASITLLKRLRRGANVTRGHQEHYYQRAILLDGVHRPTVAAYAVWMAACAGVALAGLKWAPEYGALLLAGMGGGFSWYCRAIDRRWALRAGARHAD